MAFIKEPISDMELVEKHKDDLFYFGIRTWDSIGQYWMADRDSKAYLLSLGRLGPGLTGDVYALIWNDEVIKLYAESHEEDCDEGRALIIDVFLPQLHFPKRWSQLDERERLVAQAIHLISESLIERKPYRKDRYKQMIVRTTEKNWDDF